MNIRSIIGNFVLVLVALIFAILLLTPGIAKGQSTPVELSLYVGCPTQFGDFTLIPFGYKSNAQVTVISDTDAHETQFVGYYPDGYERVLEAGQHDDFFFALLPGSGSLDGWLRSVEWKVSAYGYNDLQPVSATASLDSISPTCYGQITDVVIVEPTMVPPQVVVLAPEPYPQCQNGQLSATNGATGRTYCYYPQAGGVVPVPPNP